MFKHKQPFMYNLGLNYLLNNLKISCLKKQGLYNITIKIINYSPLPSAVFSARFAFVCLKLKWCRIYKRVHVNTIKYYTFVNALMIIYYFFIIIMRRKFTKVRLWTLQFYPTKYLESRSCQGAKPQTPAYNWRPL